MPRFPVYLFSRRLTAAGKVLFGKENMTTIAATPDALDELIKARATAEKELRTMCRINHAFTKGRSEFIRYGFADADFQKFSDTIERHPEYGPVPFSPCLMRSKMAQINRLEMKILAGKRFLTSDKAI